MHASVALWDTVYAYCACYFVLYGIDESTDVNVTPEMVRELNSCCLQHLLDQQAVTSSTALKHFRALSHIHSYQVPSFLSFIWKRSIYFPISYFVPLYHVIVLPLPIHLTPSFPHPAHGHAKTDTVCRTLTLFFSQLTHFQLSVSWRGYPPCEHEADQGADEYHHLVKHG